MTVTKRPNAKRGAVLAAAVAIATAAFVAPWEGLYTKPYRDMVGVLTVCYGETEGVKPSDRYTPQQCSDMLAKKLPRYYAEISSCWGQEIEARLTDNMRVAFTSGAYNFGSGAFCKSSMVRALEAGDFRKACHALRLYNRAGGRVVRGLDNRRKAEEKLCLDGL
jgi:lysozyme